MSPRRLPLLLAAAAVVSAPAFANPPEPVSADPAADLSWLSGAWRHTGPTGFSEEIWTSPEGGMMLAVSRTVRDGETVGFEFLRITLGETAVLTAQPGGAQGAQFSAVDQGPGRIVFANLDNEYPTHIEYALQGEALTARIWGSDGPGTGPSWRWEPAAP